MTNRRNNTAHTSFTNHWQKAGPIHSLACTPQSIHTAFLKGRVLFPNWQERGIEHCLVSTDICMCVCVCMSKSSHNLTISPFSLYLEHIEGPSFIGLTNRKQVHQVWVCPVHLKHPTLNLSIRVKRFWPIFSRLTCSLCSFKTLYTFNFAGLSYFWPQLYIHT